VFENRVLKGIFRSKGDEVANDVNLLGNNMYTIEKNTETLIDASKEAGLEINVEKTRYMFAVSSP
jgi:hypothetical protein